MKTAAIVAAQLLLASTMAWSQPGNSVSEYAGLRDKVKGGDLSVDFKRLRISYAGSPERRQAKDTEDQKKTMIQAINAKDFTKAVKNAEVVLENDYADMDAHFAEYLAYRELDDGKQAEFHRSVFDGLIRSIFDSGDGKTPETAYVVISVDEEYVLLRVLHLSPAGQSLLHEKGHSFDLLEAKDPKTGGTINLYFNVDIPMGLLEKALGGKN
jgi:Domain of unknown function (DUF4919)